MRFKPLPGANGMNTYLRFTPLLLLSMMPALLSAPASAQNYPTKPVRMLVRFRPAAFPTSWRALLRSN
jgi:hypothetical protein